MMINSPAFRATMAALHSQAPLVHNLTSAVVANFTANALLAVGASPAMVEALDEIPGFVAAADALSVNLGSLTPVRRAAIEQAVAAAQACGTPFVLDPVGAGGIAARTEFAQNLAARGVAAIRGNASEILGLAGLKGGGRGVDTGAGSEMAVESARSLARQHRTIVAVTGVIDYVTDGEIVLEIAHGHPMMTRVTGMGCAASAIVAACVAVQPDRLLAVAHALTLVGVAGERAAACATGPGSLAVAYLDELARM